MFEFMSMIGSVGILFSIGYLFYCFIKRKPKKNGLMLLGLSTVISILGLCSDIYEMEIIFGFLSFVFSILMLIISFIRKSAKKVWLKVLVASFALMIFGVALSPTPSEATQEPTIEVTPDTSIIETPQVEEVDVIENTATPGVEDNTIEAINNISDENSTFEVHFLDVGQGDAELIICDDHAMLIDGGSNSEAQFIYSYLDKLDIDYLDIIIATHAHEDHVGGLSAALNKADVGVVLSPVADYDSETFNDFVKYVNERGKEITVPNEGDEYQLGSATVTILGLLPYADDPNETSIICRVDYYDTSFLFTGDAEYSAEKNVLSNGSNLSADVLKVAHHGSDTSTMYSFLNAVLPTYSVIEVGADNSYGHPDSTTLDKLEQAESEVYRTDLNGTITMVSDGINITVSVEKNLSADSIDQTSQTSQDDDQNATITSDEETTAQVTATPTATPDNQYHYIGNVKTKKFHTLYCSSLPDEQNRVYFYTRQEAIDAGYIPCKRCNP